MGQEDESSSSCHDEKFPEVFQKLVKDAENGTTLQSEELLQALEIFTNESTSESLANSGLEKLSFCVQWAPSECFASCVSRLSSLLHKYALRLSACRIIVQFLQRDSGNGLLQALLRTIPQLLGDYYGEDDAFFECLCTLITALSWKISRSEEPSPEEISRCFIDLTLESFQQPRSPVHFRTLFHCAELLNAKKISLASNKSAELHNLAAAQLAKLHADPLRREESYRFHLRSLVAWSAAHADVGQAVLQSALQAWHGAPADEELARLESHFHDTIKGMVMAGHGSYIRDFLEKVLESRPSNLRTFGICFTGLSLYFQHDPSQLRRVIEKVVQLGNSAKLHTFNILLRMASEIPRPDLFQPLLELMQRKQTLTGEERIALTKAFLAATVNARDEDQAHALGYLFTKLQHLFSQNSKYLSSVEVFISAMADQRSFVTVYSSLNILCAALENCDKYNYQTSDHLSWMLPSILKVLQCVHSIWDPNARTSPEYKKASWLNDLSSYCYSMIKLFCTNERVRDSFFNAMANSAESLARSLTRSIEEMELDHFLQLLEVIESLVNQCPAPVFIVWHKSLLTPILSRCLSSVSPGLSTPPKLNPEVSKLFKKSTTNEETSFYTQIFQLAASVIQVESRKGELTSKTSTTSMSVVVKLITSFWSELNLELPAQQRTLNSVLGAVIGSKRFSHEIRVLIEHIMSSSSNLQLFEYCLEALLSYFEQPRVNISLVAQKFPQFFSGDPSAKLSICRSMLRVARVSPSDMLEPVMQFLGQETLLRVEENILKQAAVAAIVSVSPGFEQAGLLNPLLQPAKQYLESLVNAPELSIGIFLEDEDSSRTIHHLDLLSEALNRFNEQQDEHPLAQHLSWLLSFLLKFLRLLNSAQQVENAAARDRLSDMRIQCYQMFNLCSTSRSLTDSFFSSTELAALLGVELSSNVNSLEFEEFIELLKTVNTFARSCPRRHFYEWLHLIVPGVVSRCLSTPTHSSSEALRLAPEVGLLLRSFVSFPSRNEDQLKSFVEGVVHKAIEFLDKLVDEARVQTKNTLFRRLVARSVVRGAVVWSDHLEPRAKVELTDLLLKTITHLWSVSKQALLLLPGMRAPQLNHFREKFQKAGVDQLAQRSHLDLLLRVARSTSDVELENSDEVIIDFDSRLGYKVTSLEVDDHEELQERLQGSPALFSRKLYLPPSTLIQTESLVAKYRNNENVLAKWLVSDYQRALAALLFTVPIATKKILVIGFGGGALSVFAENVFGFQVTGVDLNPTAVRLAKAHFGVAPEMKIYICDGLEFVTRKELEAEAYDAVIVDVVGKPGETPKRLDAPPSTFLQESFLGKCKTLLRHTGALIMNSSIAYRKDFTGVGPQFVQTKLAQVFEEPVYNIMYNTNVCFIAFASKQAEEEPKNRGVEAIGVKIAEEDYNVECLEGIGECLEKMGKEQFTNVGRIVWEI